MAPQEKHWLVLQGIEVSDAYDLSNACATLSNIFTYSDLKTFCGIDIDSIASRLHEAETYFQRTYQNIDPLTSNRQKRVVRIVERGVTRVAEQNVGLVLKSAELILLISSIVNILDDNTSAKWRGMSPVSMENIALFFPA